MEIHVSDNNEQLKNVIPRVRPVAHLGDQQPMAENLDSVSAIEPSRQ